MGPIDAYIADFPPPVRAKLRQLRALIRKTAPEATEKISYRIPTFHLNGNLVHFAGYAGHIGFYPGPSALEAFAGELGHLEHAKGSVRFPLSEPLPVRLITRMVKYRAAENTSPPPKRTRKQKR